MLLISALSIPARADIQYIYDEAGRLVQAIAPNGESARWQYDAAGNITAITRNAAASIVIGDFTPNSGLSGTEVTILGSGFGATPAENAVRFNGIDTTVLTAAANKLTVTVPAGASSGLVTVTSPNGTATSSTVFSVLGASTAPMVTNFTPTVGVSGTKVTITGANFSSTLSNNVVRFNGEAAGLVSATATSLVATVPRTASSGRISVATRDGVGTSSADFIVPPAGVMLTDVVFTARATLGGPAQTVSISSANKVGLVLFDVEAGQRLGVSILASTLANSVVAVYAPDGQLIANASSPATNAGSRIETQPLPTSGTYTLLVRAVGSTGTMDVTMATTVSDAVVSGGNCLTVASTVYGQIPEISVPGTAGQTINLSVFGSTLANASLKILNPDGSPLQQLTLNSSLLSAFTPTATATYRIRVEPAASTKGYFSVVLPRDVTGTMAVDGATLPVTIGLPGQQAKISFAGTAGQTVGLGVTGNSINRTVLRVLQPDGQTVLLDTLVESLYGDQNYVLALPVSGSYTIMMAPQSTYTGNASLTLSTDVMGGTLTVGGTGVAVSIARPGQRAQVSFSGTAGQNLTLDSSGLSGFDRSLRMEIYGPSGATVTSCSISSTTTSCPVGLLAASGTYSVLMTPYSARTGSVTLSLSTPPDVTGTMAVDGATLPVTIGLPGQQAKIGFSGTAGQAVGLGVTGNTISSADLQVLHPDGKTVLLNTLVQSQYGSENFALTLPASGSYTIMMAPRSTSTGKADLTLSTDVMGGTLTVGGTGVAVSIARPGQRARVSFSGIAGQNLTLDSTGLSGFDRSLRMEIYGPSGATVTNCSISSTTTSCPVGLLAASGTYSVLMTPTGARTGSVTLSLSTPPDVTGTMAVDGATLPVTIGLPGQQAKISFAGTAGQTVGLGVTGNTISSAALQVLHPDGRTVLLNTSVMSQYSGENFALTLPVSGSYTIVMAPRSTSTGKADLTLSTDVMGGTLTVGGTGVAVSIARPGQRARVSFSGTAGQNLTLDSTGLSGFVYGLRMEIYGPSGATVTSCSISSTTTSCPMGLLAANGTYSVLMTPTGAKTGSVTLSLSTPPDVTGTMAVDGATLPVTIGLPGQQAKIGFAGTAGQAVGLGVTGNTISSAALQVLHPDGKTVLLNTSIMSQYSGENFALTLPASGSYTIVMAPRSTSTGKADLTLSTDVMGGTLTVGGTGVAVSIARPGQRARVSFSGTAGQNLTLDSTGLSGFVYGLRMEIYGPSGATVTSCSISSTTTSCPMGLLAANGTYSVLMTPTGAKTGSVTLSLSTPPDVTGTMAVDGETLPVKIALPGQQAKISFAGTAGQTVGLGVTGNTIASAALRVLHPDGKTVLLNTSVMSQYGGESFTLTLPVSGSYMMVMVPQATYTGKADLTLSSDVMGGTLTVGGTGVAVSIARPGQRARVSFSGTAGQNLTLDSTGFSGFVYGLRMEIYGPSGASVKSCSISSTTTSCPVGTLAASGTYSVVMTPTGARTGSVTLGLK